MFGEYIDVETQSGHESLIPHAQVLVLRSSDDSVGLCFAFPPHGLNAHLSLGPQCNSNKATTLLRELHRSSIYARPQAPLSRSWATLPRKMTTRAVRPPKVGQVARHTDDADFPTVGELLHAAEDARRHPLDPYIVADDEKVHTWLPDSAVIPDSSRTVLVDLQASTRPVSEEGRTIRLVTNHSDEFGFYYVLCIYGRPRKWQLQPFVAARIRRDPNLAVNEVTGTKYLAACIVEDFTSDSGLPPEFADDFYPNCAPYISS